MNYFDLILLLVTAYFLIRGAYRGFIKELFGFLALIIAITACYLFGDTLSMHLANYWESKWKEIISYLLLFTSTYLIIKLLADALTKLSRAISLNFINRTLGAIFGLLKSVFFIVSANYLYMYAKEMIGFNKPDIMTSSTIYPIIQDITNLARDIISRQLL